VSKKLIRQLSKIKRLPVEVDDVIEGMRLLGVKDDISYFADADLSIRVFSGMIRRYENKDGTFSTLITYGHIGEEWERLVCTKELLHILDPDYVKTMTYEAVETLISKMILPPEFIDFANDGPHVNHDRITVAYAIAALFPMAARDLMLPVLKDGKRTLSWIAQLAELPEFAVQLVMSDIWPGIHDAILME